MEPPSGSPCGQASLPSVADPPLPTLPGWHRSPPPAGPAPGEVAAPPLQGHPQPASSPSPQVPDSQSKEFGEKISPQFYRAQFFRTRDVFPYMGHLHGSALQRLGRRGGGTRPSLLRDLGAPPSASPGPSRRHPPRQSRPRLPPHVYVSSGVLLAESELCFSAALWLLNLTDLKFVHDIQTHVAARKPHRSLSGKAAACRQSSQMEIYNSDLGLIRPL